MMGRKKARFLTSDQYGRHVAAWRCAELLQAQEGEGGPIELRQEDSRYAPWDDLTEVHRDARGHQTQHVWQVKRQQEMLKREELGPLLKTLHENPSVVAHLAFHKLVDVQKVGSLVSLSELCERVRQPGFDPDSALELSTTEKNWLQFLRELLGCSNTEVLALLVRMEVEELREERSLQRRTRNLLERHFTEPDKAHDRLLTFLANHTDGAVRITAALLEERVLEGLERRIASGTTSATSLRAEYLDAAIASYQRLSPLRLLTGRGAPAESGPRLADIFTMPALRASAEEEAPLSIPNKPRMQGNVIVPPDDADEQPFQALEHLLSRPDELRLVDLLLDPGRLAERPRYLLEGSVGAGKSTALEHLRFKLAERARQAPDAPLPVRVEARDLADGLEHAVDQGSPRLDPRLLQAHSGGFVYLVDGLDEVEQRRARRVQDSLEELSRKPSTVALVMAGRPSTTYVEVPSGTVRLRVVPWSRAQVDEFLERWRQYDPDRVEAMGQLPRIEALLPVLTTPLTATFALLLVQEEPDALRSRAALFRGIEEKLFSDWAKRRSAQSGAAEISWASIAPAFRRLALESLKSGKEELTRADIRRHLGREALDREQEWLDDAHRRFGLLLVQEDGRYRFLLKGIAEHLAGAALLAQGRPAILQAAQYKWAEEPVRHAIGLGLEREGVEWVIETIHALLPKPGGIRIIDLRPLLIAARATLDLGEEAIQVAEPVAKALATLLTLETSVWVPQVTAEVVREMARLGGPCWDALMRRVAPHLHPRCSPAEWYLARNNQGRDDWLEALTHRDAGVRSVAMDQLAAWVDEPTVRHALLDQLLDQTHLPFSEAPALRAGLVLRRATRDEPFQRILPELLALAEHGGQLLGGAVALALRPGEAPAPLLANCLRELAKGGIVYPEVLQELAAHPDGEAALGEGWKDWRNSFRHQTEPVVPVKAVSAEPPPLSDEVLRNLLRAIGPAVARWSPNERQQFGLLLTDKEVTRALCEAAWEHPQAMLERLEHQEDLWLPPESELHLGEAAVRHPALRAALLARWERCKDESERSSFPGGALSALVARGDETAAEAYAQWLRTTFWLQGSFVSVFLSPAALRHPTVRPVAIERARNTWQQYRVGKEGEKGREYLWGGTMASVLSTLRPAWEGDTELKLELLSCAREGDEETLTHILSVFSKPPYPKELGDLLIERFDGFAENVRDEQPWHIAAWLSWAEQASIADRLQDSLERLHTWESWVRYQATSILLSVRRTQAAELSRQAAETWPVHWNTYFLPRSTIARLARSNVSTWFHRLCEVLKQRTLPVQAVFLLARILGPLLPPSQWDTFHTELYRRLGRKQFLWFQNGRDAWSTISFADQYAQILFETGGNLARR
jgi:hypothetical protein